MANIDILEIRKTRIAYRVEGNPQGQKLIFIHGLFLNSDCWKYQLEHFASKYHILRFDLHGHGRSFKPGKRFTIRKYVEDMMILLEQIGWQNNLIFVGHSLGGMVALVYAIEQPEKVAKLVIASSYCFVSNEALTDVLGRVKGNPLEKFALGIGKRGLSPYNKDQAQWLAKMVTDHMTTKDALYATAASAGFNICEQLKHLDIPTLLIVGEKDITTPVWASEMLHEWLPNSKITVIKNAGHLVIIDHYKEFNDHVEHFIIEG